MNRLGTYYRYLVAKELRLPLSGDIVLDIGCYDGFLLSQINAYERFGIDIQHIVKKYPDIQYIEGDFLNYDFKDKKFDRIFALDVLEHVRENKVFLDKITDLLFVGGIAILSVPCENIKIFPSFLQDWVDKKWSHTYRRGYTPQKIKQLLSDKEKKISIDIIYWNCPFFRFLYLPLSLFWRISSSLTRKLFNIIVELDSKFQNGDKGFLWIVMR